jgi:hypothetical protein
VTTSLWVLLSLVMVALAWIVVVRAIRLLSDQGSGLERPAVATLVGSNLANLTELRAGTIRVLFAFDPRRAAILLLGGGKRGQWSRWYLEAIPAAERIYARHLAEIERQEGR